MNKSNRLVLSLIISAIVGIITGILVFNGTIAIELLLIPIAFATIFAGISIILLWMGTILSVRKETREKIGKYGNSVILGATGTLATGVLGLTFETILVAGNLLTALLIAFGVFFFILNFISLILLTIEFVNDNFYKKDNYCNYEN